MTGQTGSPVIGAGWHILQAGDFTALDPAATITPPTGERPEFKIDIPRFTLGFDNPLDHVKAIVTADRRFATGNGLAVAVDDGRRMCMERRAIPSQPTPTTPVWRAPPSL